MPSVVEFLVAHGHVVVFVWVLAAQAGVPLPELPLLLVAGALAATGQLSFAVLLVLSLVGSLLSDVLWFALGRRYGVRVLALLCRISLEPDSCVRRTQGAFARRGALTLVTAKFVPGLSTAAPPLAGLAGMSLLRFVWLDTLGGLLWFGVLLGLGYACGDRVEQLVDGIAVTGTWLLWAFCAVVVVWIAARYLQRRAFVRGLRVARIEPQELERLQQADGRPFLVDLRHALDVAADPFVVPGALRLDVDEVQARHAEIPRDRDVVLYCT